MSAIRMNLPNLIRARAFSAYAEATRLNPTGPGEIAAPTIALRLIGGSIESWARYSRTTISIAMPMPRIWTVA